MDIIKQQQDDNNPDLWHFKIGGIAADGLYRLADLSRETTSPADWLAANQAEAQAVIDAGVVNEELNERVDFGELERDITNQLAWADTTIPEVDTGLAAIDAAFSTPAQRAIIRGMLQNQRRAILILRGMLRAWRYVVRRLA